jgi:argininosuccinate lyase
MFDESTVKAINFSIDHDKHLAVYEVRCAREHLQQMVQNGAIGGPDATVILAGIDQIAAEIATRMFRIDGDDEDIHSAFERRLREIAGDTGTLLTIGRARNDLVVTEVKMWIKDETAVLSDKLAQLITAFEGKARDHVDTIMPGLTHFQVAQPTTFAHYCMAHAASFQRDYAKLADVVSHMDECPLGAAGLTGIPYSMDRFEMAHRLGFARPAANTMDAVSDRDFVLDALYVQSLISLHMSRLAEDFVIFLSSPYGMLTFPSELISASKIMPHKKNPDVIEIMRGKSARVSANLATLLSAMKGLTMGYSKDMQADKQVLIETFRDVHLSLDIAIALVEGMAPNVRRMREIADNGFSTSTDLADDLFRNFGVPFAKAHHIVADIVDAALAEGKRLDEMDLAPFLPANCTGKDMPKVMSVEESVSSRSNLGSPGAMAAQLQI